MGPAIGRIIYVPAFLFGLLIVGLTFPHWAIFGGLPTGAPPTADFATHVVGQRYFLASGWHWPILIVKSLAAPWGTNIAFTDSNPLAVTIAKSLRPILPPFDQVVTIWQVVCFAVQPVAAVFALRCTGQRMLIPACAVALMAVSQPAFLAGFWHSALNSQFTLLLAVGLYFRIVRGSAPSLAAATALLPTLLFIHPYLVAMVAAIIAAAPLTLFLRGDRTWRVAVFALAFSMMLVVVGAFIFGYNSGQSPGGYGIYSLNILGPFFPSNSVIFPGFTDSQIDATGGQKASEAYLGIGLLILLTCTVFSIGWLSVRSIVRRHFGLIVACLALTLLAISNRGFVGTFQLFRVHTAVGPLEVLRGSGRLFWPVTYVLLIGAVATISERRARLALMVLPICAVLQVVDTLALRAHERATMTEPQPWLFDPELFRHAARAATQLTIIPPFGCVPGRDMALMQPLWIGAETLMLTNTVYAARIAHPAPCDARVSLEAAPPPLELLVIEPGFEQFVRTRPWASKACRTLAAYTLCAANATGLDGLQPLSAIMSRDPLHTPNATPP